MGSLAGRNLRRAHRLPVLQEAPATSRQQQTKQRDMGQEVHRARRAGRQEDVSGLVAGAEQVVSTLLKRMSGLPCSKSAADPGWNGACSVWVPCHRLLPLDLQMAKRKQDIMGKEQLGLAYKLAAEQNPLRIWEDVLIVHRRRRGSGGTASGSAEGGTRERLPSSGTDGGSGRGSRSEATLKFPPSFEDGEETNKSKAQFPQTPPRSGRKPLEREFEHSMRSGKASEATFRFPPGFVEREEAWSSEARSLPTPSPFGRKAVKREFEDGMSREDMEALYEDPDADEVRERRDMRAKRIRQDSMPTPELLPSQGSKALAEVEVVEISD